MTHRHRYTYTNTHTAYSLVLATSCLTSCCTGNTICTSEHWLLTWGGFVHCNWSRLWCLLLLLFLVKLSVGSTTELVDTTFFNKAWLGTARDLTLARRSGQGLTTWCSRHSGWSHISLCNRRARADYYTLKIENNNTIHTCRLLHFSAP